MRGHFLLGFQNNGKSNRPINQFRPLFYRAVRYRAPLYPRIHWRIRTRFTL